MSTTDNINPFERLELTSPDIVAGNIEKIRALFPNVVTEGPDGHAIDFDLLRQELSGEIVEGPQERYRLDWPGKRAAMLAANTPITKTLRPCRKESVNFDTTENLFIEGDNLDALKLLQDSYQGKVKMIYIDPPYNTGKDFIYKDNFTQDKAEYLEESGQVDEEGGRLVANTESNGRFHSDWLSMMYPRLKLARNLLRDDGVLYVSIDSKEAASLKQLLDEIFGKDNYVGTLTWKARAKPVNQGAARVRPQDEVDYVHVYQRSDQPSSFLEVLSEEERNYPKATTEGRRYRLQGILKSNRGVNERTTMRFSVNDYTPPEGKRWQAGKDRIQELWDTGYIEINNGIAFRRYYEDEEPSAHKPFYCFMNREDSGTSESGKSLLNELMGENHGFDTVKPIELITNLVRSTLSDQDILLDFFLGSATSFDAVQRVNHIYGTTISVIGVQLSEDTLVRSDFQRVDLLSKERIRRAGEKILEENPEQSKILDVGFRVLKVDAPNMLDVHDTADALTQDDLLGKVTHIRPDRSAEDLLFQVILNRGLELSQSIERDDATGQTLYRVGGDNLAACFAHPGDGGAVTTETVKAMAAGRPLYAVFRDDGFASDADKINAAQLFEQLTDDHTRMLVI